MGKIEWKTERRTDVPDLSDPKVREQMRREAEAQVRREQRARVIKLRKSTKLA